MDLVNKEKSEDKQNRFSFVDVLKGVCILFIIITHFSWSDEERLRYIFPFWIDMAVPIFMVVSGYVYSSSYTKRKIVKLEDAYSVKNIANKILRYTIPFLYSFLLELFCLGMTGHSSIKNGVFSVFQLFLTGGVGPGNYYYPVMIQLVFVFPVLFFLIRNYKHKGLLVCVSVNALYEIIQRAYEMNLDFYRLIMLRYVMLVSIGIYLALWDHVYSRILVLVLSVIGMTFIIEYYYLGYEPIVLRYWTGTSFVSCLFILPFVMVYFGKCERLICLPLELLGRASYNIFLVQKVWYFFENGIVTRVVPYKFGQLVVHMMICISVGVLFYFIETPITKKITKKIYTKLA